MKTKNNKPKRKLAISMLSRKEIEKGVTPFDGANWIKRKKYKKKKELLRNKNVDNSIIDKILQKY